MTRATLVQYFSRYGAVKSGFVSRIKRFGCVTFEKPESKLKALQEPIQYIDGVRVEVKLFNSKKR